MIIDQALGESSRVRYHSPKLQTAIYGLFRALDGWRGVAHANRDNERRTMRLKPGELGLQRSRLAPRAIDQR